MSTEPPLNFNNGRDNPQAAGYHLDRCIQIDEEPTNQG